MDTVGGLLAKTLGRVPIVGSRRAVHGIRLTGRARSRAGATASAPCSPVADERHDADETPAGPQGQDAAVPATGTRSADGFQEHRPGPRAGDRKRMTDHAGPLRWPEGFRAGFASFVGRPNAGKSTLTNALVGQKVAITSDKPQTTRHAIRGIVHRDDGQLVLVDTPGLHRPRTLLGQRLNDLVARDARPRSTSSASACRPTRRSAPATGSSPSQLGAAAGARRRSPIVTKTDLVDAPTLAEQLLAVAALGRGARRRGWAAVVPVSAVDGRPGRAARRHAGRAAARGSRRCTRTVSSPTSRRRSWSPS